MYKKQIIQKQLYKNILLHHWLAIFPLSYFPLSSVLLFITLNYLLYGLKNSCVKIIEQTHQKSSTLEVF